MSDPQTGERAVHVRPCRGRPGPHALLWAKELLDAMVAVVGDVYFSVTVHCDTPWIGKLAGDAGDTECSPPSLKCAVCVEYLYAAVPAVYDKQAAVTAHRGARGSIELPSTVAVLTPHRDEVAAVVEFLNARVTRVRCEHIPISIHGDSER